jgi:hypothetical protein
VKDAINARSFDGRKRNALLSQIIERHKLTMIDGKWARSCGEYAMGTVGGVEDKERSDDCGTSVRFAHSAARPRRDQSRSGVKYGVMLPLRGEHLLLEPGARALPAERCHHFDTFVDKPPAMAACVTDHV